MPGFAGGSKSQELQNKEGALGAFFKGVFTTILATPCSGPMLGALFAYTLSQPPLYIYIIYASIGLGMASPFLVAGAFPAMVRWLPQPGAWMELFKNLMGFVLLATVVFLFSTINADLFIATLAVMIGIWFSCWLVGQIKFTASLNYKLRVWAAALGIIALVTGASFKYLSPHEKLLPWEPFSPDALASAQADGKTVLVDFTANWCPNCKLNLRWAIDTQNVKDVVDKNGVVALLADWTDRSSEIKESLAGLNATSIPILAIYPAGRPDDVIVLRDLLREKQVIEAIEQAGPSSDASTSVAQTDGSNKRRQ